MLFLWSIHRCFLSIPGFDLVLLPFRRSLGPPAVPEHPLTRWPFRWRRVQTLEVTRTPRSEPTRFARTQRNAAIGRVEGPNSSSMLSVSSASAAAAGQTQRLRALVRCTHTHILFKLFYVWVMELLKSPKPWYTAPRSLFDPF